MSIKYPLYALLFFLILLGRVQFFRSSFLCPFIGFKFGASSQIRSNAKKALSNGERETDVSDEEVRRGTFAAPADERFFGIFFDSFNNPRFSIPERLLGSLFEVFANADDMVG